MIDLQAIQRSDPAAADTLPTYDEGYVRLNAGISASQTGDPYDTDSLEPYLRSAIRKFETDTLLRVYRHSYTYEIDSVPLVIDPERGLLVPGFECMVTGFECDGTSIPSDRYRVLENAPTGSAIIRPALGTRWSFEKGSALKVSFDAGMTGAMPAALQSVLAVRIRFDVYGNPGDLMRYNEERRSYTVGTIVHE